jgi:hypothetical protein
MITGQPNTALGMNHNDSELTSTIVKLTNNETQNPKQIGHPTSSARSDDLVFTQLNHSAHSLN